MRILVFGDSVTQGHWDTKGGWVNRLWNHYSTIQTDDLQNRNEPTVFNLGISADNSRNILNRIADETQARTRGDKLPIVILQIGVNDSSTDNGGESRSVRVPIEEYEDNLEEIITTVQPLCSKLIFVGSSACDETRTTPVSWGNFHYTNESIETYENVMKKVADRNDLLFIPIFDKFLHELEAGKNFVPDGLHPNNDGHKFISELVLEALDKSIKETA